MPTQFTRAFRNIFRAFPGAGQWGGPTEVRDDVLFNVDYLRPWIAHGLTFSNEQLTGGGGGGGTVTLNHGEPSSGFFRFPVIWVVSYDGAANVHFEVQVQGSGNTADPWGSWIPPGALGFQIHSGRVVSGEFINVACVPYMRGIFQRVVFTGTAAASNVSSLMCFVDVPAECIDAGILRPHFPNFVHTRALP